jgi:hypothetical protein
VAPSRAVATASNADARSGPATGPARRADLDARVDLEVRPGRADTNRGAGSDVRAGPADTDAWVDLEVHTGRGDTDTRADFEIHTGRDIGGTRRHDVGMRARSETDDPRSRRGQGNGELCGTHCGTSS